MQALALALGEHKMPAQCPIVGHVDRETPHYSMFVVTRGDSVSVSVPVSVPVCVGVGAGHVACNEFYAVIHTHAHTLTHTYFP